MSAFAGLENAQDAEIWSYAGQQDFVIASARRKNHVASRVTSAIYTSK